MRKRLLMIGSIASVILMFLCIIGFSIFKKESRRIQQYSAYSGLMTSLIVELEGYYDENGQYPQSLGELGELSEIAYPDGSTPDMLENFMYESKETECKLSYSYRQYGSDFERTADVYLVEGELQSQQ